MVPHGFSEDFASSSSYPPSPCFGSSSKVNGLREFADRESAGLAFWHLLEAVAQVDRDPRARQILQLFVRMLRQRATHGRPSGQDRKADGQDRRSSPDSLFDYSSYTFIKQKMHES